MPRMGAKRPLVEENMPLSLDPVDEQNTSADAVGRADTGGSGSSDAARSTEGGAATLDQEKSLARTCCARPTPPGPATLTEAMDEACKCSMEGDLYGLQAALTRARTFDGFAMNVEGTQGRTPLYKACHGRQPEVVQWLLVQTDYVPDKDGNRDAYKAICATETGHARSKDPGDRTAFIMREHGYSGSGRRRTPTSTPSPASSPMPAAAPDSDFESQLPPVKWGGSWRRWFACCHGGTGYAELPSQSLMETEEEKAPPQHGELSKESKTLIGKKFKKDTKDILEHLQKMDDADKHELHTSPGPVSVVVDGQTFELTVEMCKFDDPPEPASSDSSGAGPDFDDPDAYNARAGQLNDTMLIYKVTEVSLKQKTYKLEVGRELDAWCFYREGSGKLSHHYSYHQCNNGGKRIITCKGTTVTLVLSDGKEVKVNADSMDDAEAICYFVQLGFNAWYLSDYNDQDCDKEASDEALHRIGSAARNFGSAALNFGSDALDVDKTCCDGCRRACSRKNWYNACKWLVKSCKGCQKGLCGFFESDVIPEHSTTTCVWLWIFALQLVCHLLFPPLVLWSRTRKADEMPERLVRERCLVLSVRWIVISGTLVLYARGDLPSMASSEPVINVMMWLFVAVTHSAHEASLDEIPQQFDDTLSATLNHRSRHVNSSDHVSGLKGRLIEHELGYFLRYGRNKHSKFSHRMTERRLHELHGDRLKIDNARFEAFHSTELQSELYSGHCILSPRSTHQILTFDEVITTLQTIFAETPDWCLKTSLGAEYGEGVVPDSVRKAAAMVRMHVKGIQRQRYSMSSGDAAAYTFAVDRLAAESVEWEKEGTSASSSKRQDMSVEKLHKCVLFRDNALRSNTDEKLRQWDELARRVSDALAFAQDGQGEKCAQRCYALSLMVVSILLVCLWIWLGAWLEEYVRHYLMLDCADMSCACWSILAVGAAGGLLVALVHLLRSATRRYKTFRTATLSDKLVKDVEQFVTDWNAWEADGVNRIRRSSSLEEERQDDYAESEPEPEPEPSGQASGNVQLTVHELESLSLEELTALSADKLHPGGFDEYTSTTDMWSKLRTCDFDRFALELSRVQSRHQRQRMLTKWKELRFNEILAPHNKRKKARQLCFCRRSNKSNALGRTGTKQKKEQQLGGAEGLWGQMIEGRVERERRIIELRAELFSRLESRLKKNHGVSEAYDAEALVTPEKARGVSRPQAGVGTTKFGEGAYEKDKLHSYLVAESILALAHMQSKKLYVTHLYCIIVVCVLDALCHPLKDLVSSWLGVPCEEDISYRCVLNETQDSFRSSPSFDFCASVIYNDTYELPCGEPCIVESTVFFSCTPKTYEILVRTVSSIVYASLVFSVFCDLAEVIRGYRLRFDAIQYFSQLTPNQGSLTHQRKNHYGLLPTFELTTKRNIIVWNRIRVFLQTYDQHNFSVSQHKITWILLIPVVFVISKLIQYFDGDIIDSSIIAVSLGEWSKYLLHVDPTPELVDTLVIKAILLQTMGGALICHMLYIGVCTTRLHEHDIPHILLLKKAEIAAGQIVPVIRDTEPLPSLFYSNEKRIKLWCKWTQPHEGALRRNESIELMQREQLSAFVKQKIEDIRKHVEDIMGIPTDDFGGLGISVRDHRKGHEEDGGHLPASATKIPGRLTFTRDGASPCNTHHRWDGWLLLDVTIHDGHDIYVDVSEIDQSYLNDEQRELLKGGTGRRGSVIIAEVNDILAQESFAAVDLQPTGPSEQLQVNPTSQYEAMMQLTQLLDSLICVMDEERRELIHAPTIEDTRPALNLPSCCCNYRIGLSRTLFATLATVMGTSLFALIKSLMED